jgi:glycolate oxidase iron-sulfur subunit
VRGEVYLFTGCVMEQLFGRINRATRDLLVHNGFTVHVPSAQRCCGALLVHDGQAEAARALAAANLDAFPGALPVILNSAGCGCAMREYGHLLGTPAAAQFAARVRDVSEFLAEVGLRAQPAPLPQKITYDDPCHLCHGQGVRTQPRDLLRQIPQATLVTHADPEDCCGSAGIYNLLQPELAAEIGRRKADQLIASGADLVASGNPGCMLQLCAHLRARGSTMRVVHPVELLLP